MYGGHILGRKCLEEELLRACDVVRTILKAARHHEISFDAKTGIVVLQKMTIVEKYSFTVLSATRRL